MEEKKDAGRWRIVLTVEGKPEDLAKALDEAVALGKQGYAFISYGSKEPDGPHVSCRTKKMRKQK